ncbi:MAG: DUF493 family protein [Acidobacteria bacterium]|nr:DUF493 family protein [Acidobacteriota bacterium]
MKVIEGKPQMEYPARVPLKVIGHAHLLKAEIVASVIVAHLGPQAESDLQAGVNCKGAYLSLTFWVVLPDEHAERPLREAIHKLPGVVMQL